ncbi:MAG: ATP-dependent DNA helicase RecG [Pseudomonadota bacterium]
MSTNRPEILFPLFAGLDSLPGIGPKLAAALTQVGVMAPRDLLFTLPLSVVDRRPRAHLRDGPIPATATVIAQIGKHHMGHGNAPSRVDCHDGNEAFQLVYFRAKKDWLQKSVPEGATRLISGKVEAYEGRLQMVHPDHVLDPDSGVEVPDFEPVYPLSGGISQRIMARAAAATLDRAPALEEWIDQALVAREDWPEWREAIRVAHAPQGMNDLSPDARARRRLAYDELFAHQMTLALARAHRQKSAGRASIASGARAARILGALPYKPTGAQTRAMAEVAQDMASVNRMSRLLQGDVGAGKTLVAMMALTHAVEAGGQGALMAPTEILARQHRAALQPLAESAGIVLEVLTGSDKGAERRAKLEALARGDIHILVGTHALFQRGVEFRDLRLVVIDEQHRFGVAERLALGQKGTLPDMLVMTATPIPRSLSLAQYGDMDISILDEKPPGRQPIKTALVSAGRIDDVVAQLATAISQGRQAYWVCPLVGESEVVEKAAAEERFKSLRAALGEGRVGLVHGQMPLAEKDAAMAAFNAGDIAVLVATTVIEVGVDVPNASIMVIEGAESFGLAQLHQLRGRVGRGSAASSCLLIYDTRLSETAKRRLEIMRQTEDGFVIAEEDLAIRGAGDLIGTAQSGLPRFRIADLERQAGLMAMARDDARAFVASDPALKSARGQAVRALLWLMEQDKAIRLLTV